MDLSAITGKLHEILPTLSYIIDLFEKLLVLLGSYLGIDLISSPSEPAEESDVPAAE